MRAHQLPRLVVATWIAVAIITAGHLASPVGTVGDATYLAAVGLASALAWVGTATTPAGRRLVPALISAGVTASALGDLIWYVNSWTGHWSDVSLADLPYYSSYLGVGTAVLVLTVAHRRRVDLDALIDTCTVVVVSVLLFWSTSIQSIVSDRGLPVLTRVVLAGYPLLDAVLLALVLRALWDRHSRGALGVTSAVGVGCWLGSDLGYLLLPYSDSLSAFLDSGWMVGGTLLASSAWRRTRSDEEPAATDVGRAPWGRLAIAVVPLGVPPVLLLGSELTGSEPPVTASAIGMVALVSIAVFRTARLLISESHTRVELAHARDAALEASNAKSRFLATMSHEIRTPLNGVLGLNELMLTTRLDERQHQYAEGIRSAGNNLLDVINGVLDFSKIESGYLELETIDFDVVDLVEGVADLLSEPARTKELELLAYCSPELPSALRGDPSRIRQVLLNLAGNAIKFTADGEVLIRAQLEAHSEDGLVVRFEVTDTGIGIAEEDGARLFEAFSQADASTTRRYGGTGLGLAISRRLVDAMGGELGLTSRPGVGSTFWFTVPLEDAHDPEVVRPRSPAGLGGRRALVVDDNQTNRAILQDQLQHWGMSVHLADGASSALDRLRATRREGIRYDLVVLDLCMPDVDGLELGRRIAEEPSIAPDHVLLMTSGPDVNQTEARAASIDVALTKPVLASRLRKTLEGLFARPGTTDDRTAPGLVTAPTPARVLVVEDGEVNQLVAVGMLRSLGHDAVIAENGSQAVAAVREGSFDLVLMDIQMPGMDGYQATREIRRLEDGLCRTPVVAMTAIATPEERDRCLAAGMDDHVSKPISRAVVAAVLEQWVRTPT